MSGLREKFEQVADFIRNGVWDVNLASLSFIKSVLIRILRVIILILRGIKDDELPLRASALTFVTLVSIVPMLSIALSISKGLGYNKEILNNIAEFSETQPEKVGEMLQQIITLVEQTNFQSLGWIGVAFLMLTATMVLNGLETTLNRIWGIARNRNMIRRVANYISLLVVIPIFIGVAGTLKGMALFQESNSILMRLLPFFSVCTGLALLYVVLPNTKVKLLPAVVSGLVGASVWLIWQNAFISLQLSVVKYNAIYGTFATIPIFLIWLHTSWIIILLGSEVAFAVQYHNTLHLGKGLLRANVRARQLLALSIMRENAIAFSDGNEEFEKTEYANLHKVPIGLVNETVDLLIASGLLAETSEYPSRYLLARSPEKVSVKQVLDIVTESGKGPEDFGMDQIDDSILNALSKAGEGVANALEEQTLADLCERQCA